MKIDYPITFLYYRNLDEAATFYEDIFDLKLEVDQGWAKIYAVNPGQAYVGLVDETVGSMSAVEDKGVLLTFVVDDVDEWYGFMQEKKVDALTEPKMQEEIGVYCFFCEDPGGYKIEIQKFVDN